MRPDLTKRQFTAELRRLGIVRSFCGYFAIADGVHVCAANAGPRLRDQLSYLMREKHKHEGEAK